MLGGRLQGALLPPAQALHAMCRDLGEDRIDAILLCLGFALEPLRPADFAGAEFPRGGGSAAAVWAAKSVVHFILICPWPVGLELAVHLDTDLEAHDRDEEQNAVAANKAVCRGECGSDHSYNGREIRGAVVADLPPENGLQHLSAIERKNRQQVEQQYPVADGIYEGAVVVQIRAAMHPTDPPLFVVAQRVSKDGVPGAPDSPHCAGHQQADDDV